MKYICFLNIVLCLSYLESVAAGDKPGIILRLAEDVDICPALLAKMFVEHYVETHSKGNIFQLRKL